jgi:hypothetical protein
MATPISADPAGKTPGWSTISDPEAFNDGSDNDGSGDAGDDPTLPTCLSGWFDIALHAVRSWAWSRSSASNCRLYVAQQLRRIPAAAAGPNV